MSLLEENLDEIIRLKNKYLLPQNIKDGVEILGVIGTLQSSMTQEDLDEAEIIASRILGEA